MCVAKYTQALQSEKPSEPKIQQDGDVTDNTARDRQYLTTHLGTVIVHFMIKQVFVSSNKQLSFKHWLFTLHLRKLEGTNTTWLWKCLDFASVSQQMELKWTEIQGKRRGSALIQETW